MQAIFVSAALRSALIMRPHDKPRTHAQSENNKNIRVITFEWVPSSDKSFVLRFKSSTNWATNVSSYFR